MPRTRCQLTSPQKRFKTFFPCGLEMPLLSGTFFRNLRRNTAITENPAECIVPVADEFVDDDPADDEEALLALDEA
eukprot:623838-Amphidinium_carterae.1